MKSIALIAALGGFILASCSDSTSTASSGIHNRSTNKLASLPRSFSSAQSPNGFLPAEVSLQKTEEVAKYPTDKHGMPTYPGNVRQRLVRTTAYSCAENEPGACGSKNAIGTILKYGQVRSAAADWSRYPVGTTFKIKGLPYTYIVDDYGSALVGTNTLDIYHPDLSSMKYWGTRKAEITVIQWGSWDRTLNILAGRQKYPHTRKMYLAAKAKVASGQVAMNN